MDTGRLRRRVRWRRWAAVFLAPMVGAVALYTLLVAGIYFASLLDPGSSTSVAVVALACVTTAFGSTWVGLRTYRRLRGKHWNWLPPRRGFRHALRAYLYGAGAGLLFMVGIPVGVTVAINGPPGKSPWGFLALLVPLSIGVAPTVGVLAARWVQRRRQRGGPGSAKSAKSATAPAKAATGRVEDPPPGDPLMAVV